MITIMMTTTVDDNVDGVSKNKHGVNAENGVDNDAGGMRNV